MTLTDKEYQWMRAASIAVLREIGVETGGSNVQFAVNPADGRLVDLGRSDGRGSLMVKGRPYTVDELVGGFMAGMMADVVKIRKEMAEFKRMGAAQTAAVKEAAAKDLEAASRREQMMREQIEEMSARLAQVETERSFDGGSTGSAGRGGGLFFERKIYEFKGTEVSPADVDNAAKKENVTLYTNYKLEKTAAGLNLGQMVGLARAIESFAREHNGKAPAAVRTIKYISPEALELMDKIAMASTPGGGGSPPMTTMAIYSWMISYIGENGYELPTVLLTLPKYAFTGSEKVNLETVTRCIEMLFNACEQLFETVRTAEWAKAQSFGAAGFAMLGCLPPQLAERLKVEYQVGTSFGNYPSSLSFKGLRAAAVRLTIAWFEELMPGDGQDRARFRAGQGEPGIRGAGLQADGNGGAVHAGAGRAARRAPVCRDAAWPAAADGGACGSAGGRARGAADVWEVWRRQPRGGGVQHERGGARGTDSSAAGGAARCTAPAELERNPRRREWTGGKADRLTEGGTGGA
jgi:phosphatidylserine decarboxylase